MSVLDSPAELTRNRRACALDGLLRAFDHVPFPVLGEIELGGALR